MHARSRDQALTLCGEPVQVMGPEQALALGWERGRREGALGWEQTHALGMQQAQSLDMQQQAQSLG